MNAKEKRQLECVEQLKTMLKPGDTVYTTLKHVSRSGMYRVINLFIIQDNEPINIDWLAAPLLEGYDERHYGCRASGCGMDMGFHLVYELSYWLFKGGFQCTGKGCPSNDHINDYTCKADGSHWHTSGGYALKQRWM